MHETATRKSELAESDMQALHINGNDLTLDDVRQVVYERRPVCFNPKRVSPWSGRAPWSKTCWRPTASRMR